MKGSDFCKMLRSELSTTNNNQLAAALGVTPPTVYSMDKDREIGPRQAVNFIRRVIDHKIGGEFKKSISPIVEFFPVSRCDSRQGRKYLPFDDQEGRSLRKTLERKGGIYAYYNSEGRIIYLGRAKKNLYLEMVQTYNRTFSGYQLFQVPHPRGAFKPRKDGGHRQIVRRRQYLYDTAGFFSCYAVEEDLIDPLEAFAIRLMPNNIINIRMEKKSLGSFDYFEGIPEV